MPRALLLALVAGATFAQGDRPGFTAGPAAALERGKVAIRFAVTRPTAVEVAILDASGAIARHLAAGMLGPSAPTPFKPNSLAQAIAWDGRDDAGRRVPGSLSEYRMRVRLGLRGSLHRIIGWNGDYVDAVRGITCCPDGTLYVLCGGGLYAHRTTTLVCAFDREGRYRRQLFPGPPGLPPEKRRGWPHIRLDDGREVPVVAHLLTRAVYPGAAFSNRVSMAPTPDARLALLGGTAAGTNVKHPDVRGGHRLLFVGTDGSVPEDFLGPVVVPAELGGTGRLALSPDGRTAYVGGFFDPGRGHCNVVWRLSLDGFARPQPFLGKLFQSLSGGEGFNDPQGLATDSDGNLYVADYGNDRVAVFAPDGRFLAELAVKHPDSVVVSRRTGAVYVLTIEKHPKPLGDQHYYVAAHNWRPELVVKFRSWRERRPVATFKAPRRKGEYGGGAYLAVDEGADPPVVWVAGIRYFHGGWAKLLDRGDHFEDLGDPFLKRLKRRPLGALGFIGDVAVVGRKLITRHPAFGCHTNASFTYDAETGEPLGLFEPKQPDGRPENMWQLLYGEMVAGQDGKLYVLTGKSLRRYAPDGQPLPFASVGQHFLSGFPYGHTRATGLFVDRAGRMFVPAAKENRRTEDVSVRLVAPDGRVITSSVFKAQLTRLGGIAVDSEGNIYVGAQVAPRGGRMPLWARGKLPPDGPERHPSIDYKQCGAIAKFAPGGAILNDPSGKFEAHLGWQKEGPVRLEGLRWLRRVGLHPVKHEIGCFCETTRFDIDPYDRLFVPDVFRFCVVAFDKAGNELGRVGSYGNMDSRGPDVTFGWPLSVECARERLYVADLTNRRVVAIRLECIAEKTCPIR